MSKLIDHISAKIHPDHKRYTLPPPTFRCVDVNTELNNIRIGDYLQNGLEYRINMMIGAVAIARDTLELERQIKNIKLQVAEEVFGEFKEPIFRVREALYMHDFQAATDELKKLYNQMFNV